MILFLFLVLLLNAIYILISMVRSSRKQNRSEDVIKWERISQGVCQIYKIKGTEPEIVLGVLESFWKHHKSIQGKFYRGAILRFFLNFHFSSKKIDVQTVLLEKTGFSLIFYWFWNDTGLMNSLKFYLELVKTLYFAQISVNLGF